jgi:hypothetical protein
LKAALASLSRTPRVSTPRLVVGLELWTRRTSEFISLTLA